MTVNGPSPVGRYGHAVTMAGSKFVVFGGQVDGEFLNDLWSFDLNSRMWYFFAHVSMLIRWTPRSSIKGGLGIFGTLGWRNTCTEDRSCLCDVWRADHYVCF